jgi:Ca2+-binding RTX toxin-like protein
VVDSFRVQGYNFVGYGNHVYDTSTAKNELSNIVDTGANAIALVANVYQTNLYSNAMSPGALTPTDNDIIGGIKAAQARGLDVMLKPHVDSLDQEWRANLAPTNPDEWFANYKSVMLHYAEIAQQTGVKTMSIGCELRSMTGSNYKSEWLDIIADIRDVYDGKLTYSAEWTEATTLSFWDKLDFIGIDGYFPLAVAKQVPTRIELQYAWTHPSTNSSVNDALGGKSPVDFLHDLSIKYGKEVQFTEIGYRAIEGTAISPGEYQGTAAQNDAFQANLYRAMFNTFASQGGDWFGGFYMWDWRAENETTGNDYHTKGRAAQNVIDRWYGMDDNKLSAPSTGMSIYGTARADRLVAGVGGTTLYGSDGNDRLTGGDGNDVLVGGDAAKQVGAKSLVSIGAYADELGGVGAIFKVLVNGVELGTRTTSSRGTEPWDVDQFAFEFANPASFQSITIVFTNDASTTGGEDRNLHVNTITINGTTIDLRDAVNNQKANSGTLYADGSFSIDLSTLSSKLTPSTTDRDILRGRLGKDTLTGGADSDKFVFASRSEIKGDVITDFKAGTDIIDLHTIDANTRKGGSQAFDWVAKHDFSIHPGELNYHFKGQNTIVTGDVNGDRHADFELTLTGRISLHAGDFLL